MSKSIRTATGTVGSPVYGYIRKTYAGVSYPLTLSGWFKWLNDGPSTDYIFGFTPETVGADRLISLATGTFLYFGAANGGGMDYTTRNGLVAADNVWHHIVMVAKSITSRTAWLDGSKDLSPSTASRTPVIEQLCFGSYLDNKTTDGLFAYFGIWSAELSTLAIESLAGGCRPIDLVAYRTSLTDYHSFQTGVNSGNDIGGSLSSANTELSYDGPSMLNMSGASNVTIGTGISIGV